MFSRQDNPNQHFRVHIRIVAEGFTGTTASPMAPWMKMNALTLMSRIRTSCRAESILWSARMSATQQWPYSSSKRCYKSQTPGRICLDPRSSKIVRFVRGGRQFTRRDTSHFGGGLHLANSSKSTKSRFYSASWIHGGVSWLFECWRSTLVIILQI